ncbi:MAG: cation diffusion facilitator family transporter [Dehalococcoidia bacterium]|nr:cation diffusion facilitator family transporter [Dehalococcoidia bacterium]
MTYSHAPGAAAEERDGDRRRLGVALGIAVATLGVEVVGGLLTGSLALLADAAHVLSDGGALALALVAIWLASRPHTLQETFGYHRAEVIAATLNSLGLIAIAGLITWHAVQRLGDAPEVHGTGLIAVAAAGLGANVAQAWVLGHSHAINVRAARLHVLSDLGGSVAALTAGVGIALTGWQPLDPLLSLVIVALVVFGALRMLRETLGILMEHTPRDLDIAAIEGALREDPDVLTVHELHAWTITSGFVALAAHIQVRPGRDGAEVAERASSMLHQRFGLHHVTIQPEHPVVHDLAMPEEADARRASRNGQGPRGR